MFTNLRCCLAAAGAGFADVIKLTYLVTDAAFRPALREARDEFLGLGPRPASSAVQVAALAWPGLLLEVEAFALVADG